MIKYSTGNIEFLGFKIPVGEASFLSSFVGAIIIFYIIIFIIRLSTDKFPKYYLKKIESFKMIISFGVGDLYIDKKEKDKFEEKAGRIRKIIEFFTIFLDIIFPIILGLVSLYIIFSDY